MERRQAEALTDEGGDELWAGAISIGTPAQHFQVQYLLVPYWDLRINDFFLSVVQIDFDSKFLR
jgi:hypothetical protein